MNVKLRIDRGLTLAEVLVVITLILILASLLFPIARRSKEAARSTTCTSNLRQIYLAVSLYQVDHDDYPPNNLAWPGLKPYYPQLLRCPESKQPYPALHYLLIAKGITDPQDERERLKNESWERCRQERGPALPVVIDHNHTSNLSLGKLLLARADGSVHSVRWEPMPTGPCGTEYTMFANY